MQAIGDLGRYTIAALATVIVKDWGEKTYFGAKPYIGAMLSLTSVNDTYGCDSGKEIVLYFLSNASTWRGEVAKAVKAELKKRLKDAGKH